MSCKMGGLEVWTWMCAVVLQVFRHGGETSTGRAFGGMEIYKGKGEGPVYVDAKVGNTKRMGEEKSGSRGGAREGCAF